MASKHNNYINIILDLNFSEMKCNIFTCYIPCIAWKVLKLLTIYTAVLYKSASQKHILATYTYMYRCLNSFALTVLRAFSH
jgi:hypothetical protein